MSPGTVNARLEASIRFEVRGRRGTMLPIDAVIDTGFNGHLSLRPETIEALGLQHLMSNEGMLADGTRVEFETFLAVVTWHGEERRILVVQSAGGNLVGMSLLEGCRLTIDVIDGGAVAVQPLTGSA